MDSKLYLLISNISASEFLRGPITWELVPQDIREVESLALFKTKIKNWKPTGCTCRLCKEYIRGLGYGFSVKDGFKPK